MFLENKFYFTAVWTTIMLTDPVFRFLRSVEIGISMPVHIIVYFVATDIVQRLL